MKSIQFKRTGVAGKIPTPESLQVGEIAIQLADHVIFTKDKEHKVVQISVSPETHAALESKVDANKKELDQTIALNDQNINAKVDEIKTATDATISANDQAINTKVDNIKRETDATIEANKNTAASELATVQEDLTKVINANKDAAAVATEELDTRINAKVDGIKERTDATILANDTAIHEKVDLIKATTDRTIADNAQHAQNQLEATYNHLTGVIEANKQEAAEAVTALSGTVEAKDTAIHKKVDDNKTHADGEIARLESRIDNIDGSSDGKFIKKDTNTKTEAWLVSRTANYEEQEVHGMEYLDYFGAYRVNGADNWGDYTGMILNVPHSWGKAHGRGFEFQYGSAGNQVRTYGYGADGIKAFSHRMYHEGDKPTPAELNVYSKQEVDRLFQKSLWLGHAGGTGWFKIASVALPQIGSQAFIRLIGGNGFNAGTIAQTNVFELIIRSSNANPHGVTFTVYQHLQGFDNQFCAVHTGADNFDIYALYFEFSAHVMAEYGAAGATLTVYDNPEKFGEKPAGATDALRVNMFNSVNNKGTLNFNANQQQEYDIEQLSSVAADGKKYLRRFRSSQPAAIWHETVQSGSYRLATGVSDDYQQLLIEAGHDGKGGLVTAGRFTATGGNNGFNIHYDPHTESAMYQIWSMPEGSLNAYFGYGSNNQTMLNIYNRLGDIILDAPNGSINCSTVLNVQRKMNIYSSEPVAEPSTHVFNIRNWGNSAAGGNRNAVLEFSDGQSYHFYTHRLANGQIEAGFAGILTAGTMWAHGDMNVQSNLYVRGTHGVEIVSDANRHIWFKDSAGNEKAVFYAENDGGVKLRTSSQQYSTRFGDGMIHTTGAPTVGSDRGLIRGYVGGGAWDAWRDRAAGILIDCPDSRNQAYSIWKATHWGIDHLAAMGVHAGGGNPSVAMHVGGSVYTWAFNGDFTAGAAVYCNDVYIRSDRRLKINVENYEENAVDKVNKLTVKTYDKVKSLKDRDVIGREIGIIAQELKEVLPEAVKLTNIGSPEEVEEVFTVSNSAVNALLIKAVQEMSKRIEYLESQVK
ncbi:tail fiber domain-containing protein [Salmonella enterica]|nr:tail fiber domain-containing protein [Salmonella enterica]